jgi:KUP system potassium uptake protein
MSRWREKLFATLARNAADITHYFDIPPEQVVEIGNRVEL